ncbi:MAG: hypothetical protein J6L82_09045 [Alphaproteobacteria bacterium]|nr:hypothetical protein [Alphaproteobacteria bacterium]
MKKLFVLILFVSSCVVNNGYYYPVHKKTDPQVSYTEKQNATFSISIYKEGIGEDFVKEEKIRKEIRNEFQKTGLFNTFSYVFFNEKSDFHFHFDIKVTGSGQETAPLAFLSGYFLTTIPVSYHSNHDITMFLYIDQKEVYSITAPVHTRVIVWLPLILLSPTAWSAGANVRKNAINYFIQEVFDKKLYMPSTFKNLPG